MANIKVIHIDDEKETLQYCKNIFSQIKNINHIGSFTNAVDAVNFVANNDVDLIFCDVEMPNNNGIWLAKNLPAHIPVVFVTAHTGFAVEAFEACALHYLIKPLTIEAVNAVLERYHNTHLQQSYSPSQAVEFYDQYLPQNSNHPPTRIFINNIGKIIVVNLSQLMYMAGSGTYTKFYMQDGSTHTSSKNLKVYSDAMVYHQNFIRVHKSYIVNKDYVKQIIKAESQQWLIEIFNNDKIEISKGKLDEILALLNN